MSSLNELRDFALLFGYQADNILFRHTHTHTRTPGFNVALFAWTY